MDLHLTDAQATAEERAAVDSELGAARIKLARWPASGKRARTRARLSTATRHGRRHRLLPVLHAIQNRIGWISPGALNYVAVRLDVAPAEVHGVASFYGMFSLQPRPPVVAHVCDDIACVTRGSEKLCAELEGTLGPAASPCSGGHAIWLRSQCLGLCERAPAALISFGRGKISRTSVGACVGGSSAVLVRRCCPRSPARRTRCAERSNQRAASRQTIANPRPLRLLHRIAQGGAPTLEAYQRLGGYAGLRKALDSLALKARYASCPLQNC